MHFNIILSKTISCNSAALSRFLMYVFLVSFTLRMASSSQPSILLSCFANGTKNHSVRAVCRLTSSFLAQYVLLGTYSQILSPWPSIGVTNQVPHRYE